MSGLIGAHGLALDAVAALLGGRWVISPSRGGRHGPVLGASIDTRTLKPGEVFFALRGDRADGHAFLDAAAAAGCPLAVVDREVGVRAPGMAVLRVADARAALGVLARGYRRALNGTRVIGVTGSNGKTTTTRFLHAALGSTMRGTCPSKSHNNDLGLPLTLLAARPGDDYLICEIGTSGPGEIARLSAIAEPEIGVITSIGRAHLERLGSVSGVAEEKADLVRSLPTGGLGVVIADSPELAAALAGFMGCRLVRVGAGEGAEIRVGGFEPSGTGIAFDYLGSRAEVPLPGAHNALNGAMALRVAQAAGVPLPEAIRGLARAAAPPMRLERLDVATRDGGVVVVNDAYNANPESMRATLGVFLDGGLDPAGWARGTGGRRVLVLGEMLEMGSGSAGMHREIAEGLAARVGDLDGVVLVGRHAAPMAEILEAARAGVVLLAEPDASGDWADRAAALIRGGDLVLLKGSRGMRLERVIDALRARGV